MPRYRITNRAKKETYEIEAPFAQDACEQLGWLIGECFVTCIREGPFTNIRKNPEKIEKRGA